MKKTLIVAAAFALTAMFAACVPSPTELCKSGINTSCTRMFECYDEATKTAMAPFIGANVAECKTKQETSANCAAKTTQDELCKTTTTLPDGGTTTTTTGAGKFDISKASSCSDKTKAMSCADFKAMATDPTKLPEDCKTKCG